MEKGQVILVLILVMTVALAIGLSIVQKSLVDVSIATKVEDSSRAFSAAEGGIEKALKGDPSGVNFTENRSSANVIDAGLTPVTAVSPNRQEPFEYPWLIAKEEVAHVWLADFNSTTNPPDQFYKQDSLDVYWGNSTTDKAALEITLVFHNGTQYLSKKWYLDQVTRNPANNFDTAGPNCSNTFQPPLNQYRCKYTLSSLPTGLMLLRARLLYNTSAQPFAVAAVGTCGQNCSIPPQARVFTSTGVAGETQRKVQVSQIPKVVPAFFDYAIFSAGDISK